MQEKLDENQLHLIQKVCELIGEVKTKGSEHLKGLKEKWAGSTRPDEATKKKLKECDCH